ncbi:MAG: UDP-N-acetylglucosamine enolpyruvoyl transferase [Candidatus Parcubacteria bacterium]
MNTKDAFVIQGLDGSKTLNGTVYINGAKNSAIKAMAAAILFDGAVMLENVPENSDIETMRKVLEKLGAKVEKIKSGGANNQSSSVNRGQTLTIDVSSIKSTDIDADLAKSMRSSVVLTGPMLARYRKVTFPSPGGCVIGARPVDLFLSGYEKMGAKVDEIDCVYDISSSQGLSSTEIFFNKITVGGTETLMMAAVLANGLTVLKNCAMEPEIVNVAEWLNSCGAKISGAGTSTITIQGTNGKLLSPKKSFITIPDRITAGSFLILGALCSKEMTIANCRPGHMQAVTELLVSLGVKIKVTENSIIVQGADHYKAISDLRTHEYPGFPTDLQAPLVTFLTQSEGESTVFETIYEGRFKYTEELIKLGATVTMMNPREVMIKGPATLRQLPDAEELTAHDIRAGFAVVLAALLGKGKFKVNNVELIDRGYENLEVVLKGLGADIQRVKR